MRRHLASTAAVADPEHASMFSMLTKTIFALSHRCNPQSVQLVIGWFREARHIAGSDRESCPVTLCSAPNQLPQPADLLAVRPPRSWFADP